MINDSDFWLTTLTVVINNHGRANKNNITIQQKKISDVRDVLIVFGHFRMLNQKMVLVLALFFWNVDVLIFLSNTVDSTYYHNLGTKQILVVISEWSQ